MTDVHDPADIRASSRPLRSALLGVGVLAAVVLFAPVGHTAEPDPDAARVAALQAAYDRGDEARARELAAALDVASVANQGLRFQATIVLARLGQSDAVRTISRTFNGSWSNVGLAFRGELDDPGVLLETRSPKEACGLVDLGEALIAGGRPDDAQALFRAILAVAPQCRAVTINLSLQLLNGGAAAEAIDLLLPWHTRDQSDEQVNAALSNAYRHLGDLKRAIHHFHFTADKRAKDPDARFLGQLLAIYLRMDDEAYWAEHWRKVVADNPEHYVGRFLLGACLHYLDEFAESNTHLDQLVGLLDHEPRVYVYRAMNRFNLGQAAEARTILDQAAKLSAVDPDVYYCLGEVLRDTERQTAIVNLERYLTLTSRSSYSNPTKLARVETMRDNLIACDRDGVSECEGPWEHPRPVLERALFRDREALNEAVLLTGIGLLFTTLLVLFVRRRRRKRASGA